MRERPVRLSKKIPGERPPISPALLKGRRAMYSKNARIGAPAARGKYATSRESAGVSGYLQQTRGAPAPRVAAAKRDIAAQNRDSPARAIGRQRGTSENVPKLTVLASSNLTHVRAAFSPHEFETPISFVFSL